MLGRRLSQSTGLVGIDFSADRVRLLQLRQQAGSVRVVGAASHSRPVADDLGNLPDLTDWLRNVLASGGFAGRRCVVVLPRDAVRVQSVRLPQMSDVDTRQAVRWEASQRFGLDPDAMEIDYIVTGAQLQGNDPRQELLLVATPNEATMPLYRAIMDSGLKPIAAEASLTAIARGLSLRHRREADLDHVRAVVEIGRTGTTILILRGDQIAFCKQLDIAGRQFDASASEHLGIDLSAASEIRTARMRAAARSTAGETIDDPETDRAVYESIRPFIGNLTKEITLSLRYYGVTFRGQPPRTLVLTGTEALEPHLARMIEHSCKLPVTTDDENESLAELSAQIQRELNRSPGCPPSWSAVIGASARSFVRKGADRSRRAAA
ncbi:MAG: pilus assembly protein PilM [Planctomycetota bacterium]